MMMADDSSMMDNTPRTPGRYSSSSQTPFRIETRVLRRGAIFECLGHLESLQPRLSKGQKNQNEALARDVAPALDAPPQP
jgi:hypothetical protein